MADFGAFIDIGVGTDAMLHVSEMGQKRVAKPSDVLAMGQEVTCWIKELDKDRDRISLTLLSPDTRTIRDLKVDEVVRGTVTRLASFGAFVDIGIGYDAMVHVKEMTHGYVKNPGDVVQVGQEIEAQVLKIDRRRGQIDLSMKAVAPLPEPEPEPEPVPRRAADPVVAMDPEEMEEEEFIPSAFELALQEAQRNSGRKNKQRKKRQWYEEDADDLVSRTLSLAD